MAMRAKNLSANEIKKIFSKFNTLFPDPHTQLYYSNEFELLIAVILSAQTTDARVNLVTAKLFEIANTPQKMLQLTNYELCVYVKSLGLFRIKSSNILKTCKILVEKFNSVLPKTREELESLPGVGRKTANVLLNTLWKYPTIAVDTHVLRVANRIGLVNTNNPLKTEVELLTIIPPKYISNAHNWLILHGRLTCKAIKPKCKQCAISSICRFYGS